MNRAATHGWIQRHRLLIPLVAAWTLAGLGCAPPAPLPANDTHPDGGLGRDSGDDGDTGYGLASGPHASVVTDVVRIHEELFDLYVLSTIEVGDPCEYPSSLDDYGPVEFTFTPDAYPYPDILGTVQMTMAMAEDGHDDL